RERKLGSRALRRSGGTPGELAGQTVGAAPPSLTSANWMETGDHIQLSALRRFRLRLGDPCTDRTYGLCVWTSNSGAAPARSCKPIVSSCGRGILRPHEVLERIRSGGQNDEDLHHPWHLLRALPSISSSAAAQSGESRPLRARLLRIRSA